MPPEVNVESIVYDWLIAHGYDGLCSENCGCGLHDFMCCIPDMDISSCVPAYRRTATQADIDAGVETDIGIQIYAPDKESDHARH